MDLSKCIILPGIVLDVNDPKRMGRVKAMVPTIFDIDYMNKDSLPWIYPFSMEGNQRFSKLENGRKIWVLHNKENEDEYWYWPMFEKTEETKDIAENYDSTEILLSRTAGEDGNIFIYYNNENGIMMSVGKTKINITTNNEIHITDGNSCVNIVGGIIKIGKEDDEGEPGVMGQKLQDALVYLGSTLKEMGINMSHKQYVAEVADDFATLGNDFESKCNEILSDTVKITK